MSQWFRMYAEVLDDPKVQRLSGEEFKGWVNILCLTAKCDGALPPVEDIGFALRLDAKKAEKMVSRLLSVGLLVETETGLKPNKWDSRQYKSDVSTDRVKRFRERSKKQPETQPETAPETEAETEHIKAIDKSIASAAKRGSRLPADFEIPREWLQWAMSERHWSADDAKAEADSFTDFWHAKAGKDAVKLDWEATWRNWVRNSRRVVAVAKHSGIPL